MKEARSAADVELLPPYGVRRFLDNAGTLLMLVP